MEDAVLDRELASAHWAHESSLDDVRLDEKLMKLEGMRQFDNADLAE